MKTNVVLDVRKDRVDIYYVQILEIRQNMERAREAIDLHACLIRLLTK